MANKERKEKIEKVRRDWKEQIESWQERTLGSGLHI